MKGTRRADPGNRDGRNEIPPDVRPSPRSEVDAKSRCQEPHDSSPAECEMRVRFGRSGWMKIGLGVKSPLTAIGRAVSSHVYRPRLHVCVAVFGRLGRSNFSVYHQFSTSDSIPGRSCARCCVCASVTNGELLPFFTGRRLELPIPDLRLASSAKGSFLQVRVAMIHLHCTAPPRSRAFALGSYH